MLDIRFEFALIAAGLIGWAAIYIASAQGMLHVSWMVSDGLLALLTAFIAWRGWRLYRSCNGG